MPPPAHSSGYLLVFTLRLGPGRPHADRDRPGGWGWGQDPEAVTPALASQQCLSDYSRSKNQNVRPNAAAGTQPEALLQAWGA